ncbi:MAG: M20 family metallopeptidase, partial [Peptococcales bacterium]
MTNDILLETIKQIETNHVIKVVQDLIKFESINPPGNEKNVADYIKNYMLERNIFTETVPISPNRYNVISRIKGKGEAGPVIFTGHMDVVPISKKEEKRWITKPFSAEVIDGYIYGRGASDMKGGLGAAMVAMGNLASNGISPPGDIILAATVDEEDLMRGSKALLGSKLISDARKVVVCEPTNLEIHRFCRGRTWAEITVKGLTAHASQQNAGVNAIDRAVVLMNKIANHQIPHEKHNYLGNFFWQVTLINGGIGAAVVPDSCTITVDARLVPGQMPKDIWNEIENIVNSIKLDLPDFEAEINILEEREPWETPEDEEIIKNIKDAFETLQLPVKQNGFLGTTDGTVFRRAGMEAVIIGPGELACVHKENERISIKQLIDAVR